MCSNVRISRSSSRKILLKLKDKHHHLLKTCGLIREPAEGFQFDVASGKMTKAQRDNFPENYRTPDGAIALAIAPNSVTYQTSRYIRWAQLESALEQLVFPVLETYLETTDGLLIRLDYADCFLWTGDWADFDSDLILGSNSRYVAKVISQTSRDWHSHSGWISDDDSVARLYNVNVSATLRPQEDGSFRPALSVLSLAQDTPKIADTALFKSLSEAQARLNDQHVSLKAVLGDIISKEMSDQIGLNLPPVAI